MSIFYLGPLVGPLFLPLVGGGLTQVWGWRSVMWFMAAEGVLVLAMVLLLLPETLCNHNNNADHQGSESPRLKAKHFLDPITSVAILRFPTVFIPVFIAAMAFGTCYVINISVQEAFSNEPYQYSPTIVGFLFLPNSIGCILVSVYGGKWVDRIMIKSEEQAGRRDNSGEAIYLPEDRLGLNAWISLALYPASIIVYGWLVQTGVTWAAPAAATFVFGAGVMMIFSATTTMAAEFVPGNSSIGIAVNNLIRNIFSSGGTAITQPLLNVMGHGWLFTMIGIIAWATGYLGVFLLKRYSEKWRGSLGKALR
jgi:MFS family permease